MSTSLSSPRHAQASTRWAIPFAALLLGAATLLAYLNSFAVPFLFDDIPAIVKNPALGSIGGAGADTAALRLGGLTTSGRPVLAWSLAFNRALSGEAVASYHVVNLAIHLGAGLCLFGLVRRALLLPVFRGRFERSALPLAAAIAALWLLHPLQTESVTYLVQRAESLAGFWYVLTLYAFVRSLAGSARLWRVVSIAACGLAMATKEVAASAPVIVLLFDRAFVAGSVKQAWRARRSYYLMLAASWLLLAALVVSTSGRGGTAGFDAAVSPWTYALTQCRAIIHYLRLCVWPTPLVFDYGLGTATGLRAVWWQASVMAALLGLATYALVRRPKLGFFGAWFFALLAPSSSIVPVVTQTMAEHRIYLALAAVVAAIVLALHAIVPRIAVAGVTLIALACAVATNARNHDYRSDLAIWADTAAKLPDNARAHNNLGQALFLAGRVEEAMAAYGRALALQPRYPETQYNLGVALARLGRTTEAIARYRVALEIYPAYPEAENNLGNALVAAGNVTEALLHYQRALQTKPDFAEAHNNLGNALLQLDRIAEGEGEIRRALALQPRYPEAEYNLGNAVAARGAMAEALDHYRRALGQKPEYAEAHVNAGNALLALGRPPEALAEYEQAVALNPALADAHFNRGSVLLDLSRWPDAITTFEAVLRLAPDNHRAERALGFALAQSGRATEAAAHYERYLRAVPTDGEARQELQAIRSASSRAGLR